MKLFLKASAALFLTFFGLGLMLALFFSSLFVCVISTAIKCMAALFAVVIGICVVVGILCEHVRIKTGVKQHRCKCKNCGYCEKPSNEEDEDGFMDICLNGRKIRVDLHE